MASRTPADADRWMRQGSKLFADALARLDDAAVTRRSALPGWTGRHLVAHVAANADALSNLVRWAATGEETPMYSSMGQRDADIETGATRPVAELRAWFASSTERLIEDFGDLGATQLSSEVRTAQGRLVPAAEIAWLRSREVMVHAVDLPGDLGRIGFDDLPPDFLAALVDDIVIKRTNAGGPALLLVPDDAEVRWALSGAGTPTRISGHLAEIAGYLAGRPSALDGDAPVLPRWL